MAMWHKRIKYGVAPLLAVVVLLLAAKTDMLPFGRAQKPVAGPAVIGVTVTAAKAVTKIPRLNLTGSVEGETSALISAKINGRIEEILVEDGAHVDAGQVIARVKVNVTPDQIHQLEQTVELSKRNLAEVQAGTTVTQPIYSGASGPSQAEIDQAAAHLERMEELYAMGAISAVKRDEAAAAYEAARSSGSAGSVSYQTIVQPSSPQVIRRLRPVMMLSSTLMPLNKARF